MISAAEDLLLFFIINNEYKIADQVTDAVFPPFEVALQDKLGVADTICLRSGDVQFSGQFIAVVDPGPGGDADLFLIIMKRGRFQGRRGCIPRDALEQQDVPFFY